MQKYSIYKPRYKKLIDLKINLHYREKILKFQKKKWQKYKSQLLRLNTKKSTRNCYYKFHDQYTFNIPKFSNKFFNNYKQTIKNNRLFQVQYGPLSLKYMKKLVDFVYLKSQVNHRSFLIGSLESRLDVMLLRTNFASTIRNARQIISHGHVLVNDECVKCCSFSLKKGDKITFKKGVHNIIEYNLVKSSFWPFPTKHVQVSYKIFQIIILEDIRYANLGNNFVMWFDWDSIMKRYAC